MRLVNADKLLEAFSNSKHIKETTSGLYVMEMEAIKEIIDNAETYNQVGHKMATAEGFITNPEWIKEERPHGEWKLLYKGDEGHCANYECSICQREIYFDAKTESLADYPFCHCGADMRGEE